jgi:hypothetical protein
MIYSKFRSVLTLSTAVLLLLATGVLAQESQININQTEGFAEGQELVFTYTQQFFCTHEPF